MTLHIGFNCTRMGLTRAQLTRVAAEGARVTGAGGFTAHHGLCVGGDEQCHWICRGEWPGPVTIAPPGPVTIVGHPGPLSGWSSDVIGDCDEVRPPKPYIECSRDILASSSLLIAAPYSPVPQPRSGPWTTIALAREALKHGHLTALIVARQ